MTSEKRWNVKKETKSQISKKKKNEKKNFSEVNQCQCKTMSVSENIII